MFEKCVKYANETPDNVLHSTQFYIKYKKIGAWTIETCQANSSTGNTPTVIKIMFP